MSLRVGRGWLAALLVAAAPFAGAQEAPQMPEPAAEMAGLDYFEGSWRCEGEAKPGPFGPGGKTTGTAEIRDTLGGFWQAGVIKSSMPEMGVMEGLFHTTYDPVAGEYVMLWVDNAGAWAESRSSGWKGDTMVYEGEMVMAGQKMMGRDSFSKGADGSLRHAAEVQLEGDWVLIFDEVCKKAQ